jgi:E-phenylitaconyl-CoA hydratase
VTDAVLYEQSDHIATITMNRPDALNAINRQMRQGLNAAWERFRDDEDAWVAIVRGEGRAFCAGADMVDGAGSVGDFSGSFWEIPTINSFESGLEIWKPTIAAVHGYCIGYGLTGALACDFILAADGTEFGYPEVQLGTPTIVGAIRLPTKTRWSDAMELLLTGDRIDAAEAEAKGFVHSCFAPDDLDQAALDLARRLTKGAPLAVRATKEMAARSADMGWSESVRMGEAMRRVVGASDDATEGFAARAERRAPRWTGL